MRAFLLLFISLFVASPVRSGNGEKIPMPIGETAEVLIKWLEGEGFRVLKEGDISQGLKLWGKGEGGRWEILLVPSGPLATKLFISFRGEAAGRERSKLLAFLRDYLHEGRPSVGKTSIPSAVLARMETAVCLRARNVQSSGVLFDPKGLILTTAHGLRGVEEVEVTLGDGEIVQGRVLCRDEGRDLAVVMVKAARSLSFVSLDRVGGLGVGEVIYVIGCPLNLRASVQKGVVNAPPRKIGSCLLWQADLEVLPGSSGSPVFDNQGNFLAVVKGRYRGFSSVAFLIPVEEMAAFLKESFGD